MSASVRGIGVAVRCSTCGLRPFDERRALRHPEAVLLVDDGDGEVAELDLLLDERVRPDDDLRIARGDRAAALRRAPSRAASS